MSDTPLDVTPGPVTPGIRLSLGSLGTALLLGLLGDSLILHSPGFGLGGFLWVAALAAGVVWLSRVGEKPLTGEGRWLLAASLLFAAGLVWRDSEFLTLLNLLGIGLCLGLAALTLRGGSLSSTGVFSYPLGLLLSSAHHLVGPLALLLSDTPWSELPRSRWSGHAAAVGRGLAIALPLLLIFGGLFAAADAVFADLMNRLITIDLGEFVLHVAGTLFFGFLAAGFLRTALVKEPEPLPLLPRPAGLSLGPTETAIVLGLLNLLFLTFVLVQVRYLFGGAELVQATVSLTYAEYARRGFFELVLVAALVLPLLLGLDWLIPAESAPARRLFRWLGGSLVALLFVIMASAVQRLLLYQAEYGLTELRLYALAFMGWMAVMLFWFILTVLRGRPERFSLGALASGLAVLVFLNAMNPAALIVRANVANYERTGRFDAPYATSLGADAVPALLEALPRLGPAERQAVEEYFAQWPPSASRDWRAWNWGRSRAAAEYEAQAAQ